MESAVTPEQITAGQLTPEQIQEALKLREQQVQEKAAEEKAAQQQEAQKQEGEQQARVEQQTAAQTELSATERLLSGQMPTDVSTSLRQFGYDVFSRPVSTFAPVTNVPVGPDYVIGPGDGFTLTMWGRVDAQHTLVVDQNGQIVLPEVGALKIWGMRFGELEGYLQHELSRKYTDFKMSVTMDRLRVIRVFVVGEASAPGSYTVSSLSTVVNALFAAGGPSKNGTLRKIRLIRGRNETVEIDLYKFLLGGDKGSDLRLQDGDTIFIPLIGSVVGVAGNVKRPAIYEMAQPMTLQQVLDLAGGITFAGWLQRVQVERVQNHEKRIVADFDLSEKDSAGAAGKALETTVQDGDVVKVFPVAGAEQNIIQLEGHVIRPGKYEFKPGMRLSDVLSYDVFLPQVNLEYGEIERLVPPDMHPITIPFHLGKLLSGDPSANLELARFDRIRLFRWDEKGKRSISIEGLVYQPGEYRLIDGMCVRDLVQAAGGLQKDAYLDRAEVTRRQMDPNGVYCTERINVDLRKALAGDRQQNIGLQDRDRVSVLAIPALGFDEGHVTVSGLGHDPNRYRLFEGMRVSDLLNLAGGLQKNAYLRMAELTRRNISQNGMVTEKININLEKALVGDPREDIVLQDYDYLVVRPIPGLAFNEMAVIQGQVRFPGTYPIAKGETLSSLIQRAGGYTDQAYLKGAVFIRESAKAVQRERLNQLINELEQSMLTSASQAPSSALDTEEAKAEEATLATKKELLAKLRTAQVTGRVVVKLEDLEDFRGSKYDLELEDGDTLMIPLTPGVVYVIGEVFNRTSLLYEEGRTVSYYLDKVGGMTREADKKQVSVVKADGSVVSVEQGNRGRLVFWDSQRKSWLFGGFMSMEMDPGDTIVVPRKMDHFFWMKTTKDMTQIIFQIAVAAGIAFAI
jgi:polysaccharide export outer membrane protein